MRNFFIFLTFYLTLTCNYAQNHSIIVYNTQNNSIIKQSNADVVRPIASITKLMTAIVALETYKLEQIIHITKKQTVAVADLITSLLVRSDNFAGELLARHYPGGRAAFIATMNAKAKEYNLVNTKFIDPTGLGIFNISTALELVNLVVKAYEYPFIRTVSNQPEIYTTIKTKYGYKEIPIYTNTSRDLLNEFDNILLTKTGYTSSAGRCITVMIEKDNQKQIIVILGERSKQHRDNLARQLIAQI
jgi:D-alanyl-D-alanine endopeptidase (penicillin-binding protein 7)